MMDEHLKRKMIDQYLETYNAFDIDGMLTVLHPEVEFRNLSGGEMNARATGIKEFRKLAEQAKELFSSRKQTMISCVTKKDKTIIEIDYEGILAADLPNGMKAGETINLKGESEFEFKDGKISSITDRS